MPLEKPCSEKSNSIHIIDLLLALFFFGWTRDIILLYMSKKKKNVFGMAREKWEIIFESCTSVCTSSVSGLMTTSNEGRSLPRGNPNDCKNGNETDSYCQLAGICEMFSSIWLRRLNGKHTIFFKLVLRGRAGWSLPSLDFIN